jgi:beta-galactosidase GanA
MKLLQLLSVIYLLLLVSGCNKIDNQSGESFNQYTQIPHLEKQGTATRLVVNGKPFLLIAGELHNSTCGGFEYMRPVWKRMAAKNLNSVIATVSWELVEPEEGKFDFSLVDSIIAGAREASLKLVLIWFGSWKNAGSIYIPSWVKKDYEKYPRARDENGKPLEILSTFGNASSEADARAFAALMRHIKETDSQEQTVVMIQVENEMGVLDHLGREPLGREISDDPGNARRDFSDPANTAYNGPVPEELIDYLVENKETLYPELFKVWAENGFKTSGTWEEVFGKSQLKHDVKDWKFYSYYTEEIFMAWNYARYVENITAEGKKEYPLPMYVNAWLKQPYTFWPGRYPSGGPLPQILDIWRAAAPSIDFLAPDIYMDEFTWVCDEYTRNGNPLFIPEARGGAEGAARAFYVFGEYDAGCFSPFGIDNPRYAENDPLDESYAVLQNMASVILENQGKGTMRGFYVDISAPVMQVELGNYIIEARLVIGQQLTGDQNVTGGKNMAGGLIIQTGPDEFIVAGKALDVFFTMKDTSKNISKDNTMRIALDAVDEGTFKDGTFIPERRLNGDETHASTFSGTGLKFPENKSGIQKVKLYSYK